MEHVKIAKTTLKSFKDSFFSHRDRLESYFACGKEFKPWDFRSEMLFSRFEMLLNCLLKIEVLLIAFIAGKRHYLRNMGYSQVCRWQDPSF